MSEQGLQRGTRRRLLAAVPVAAVLLVGGAHAAIGTEAGAPAAHVATTPAATEGRPVHMSGEGSGRGHEAGETQRPRRTRRGTAPAPAAPPPVRVPSPEQVRPARPQGTARPSQSLHAAWVGAAGVVDAVTSPVGSAVDQTVEAVSSVGGSTTPGAPGVVGGAPGVVGGAPGVVGGAPGVVGGAPGVVRAPGAVGAAATVGAGGALSDTVDAVGGAVGAPTDAVDEVVGQVGGTAGSAAADVVDTADGVTVAPVPSLPPLGDAVADVRDAIAGVAPGSVVPPSAEPSDPSAGTQTRTEGAPPAATALEIDATAGPTDRAPAPAATDAAPTESEAGVSRADAGRSSAVGSLLPPGLTRSLAPGDRTMREIAGKAGEFGVPATLGALVLLYLIRREQLDRRDPKLSAAPIDRDGDVLRFR